MTRFAPGYNRAAIETSEELGTLPEIAYFDGVLEESLEGSVTGTSNPRSVDRRSKDHNTLEPMRYRLKARVEFAPLEGYEVSDINDQDFGFSAVYPQSAGGDSRAAEVWNALISWRGRRLNVDSALYGRLEGYEIRRVDITRRRNGPSTFNIEMEEVLDAFAQAALTPAIPIARKQAPDENPLTRGFEDGLNFADTRDTRETLTVISEQSEPRVPTFGNFSF